MIGSSLYSQYFKKLRQKISSSLRATEAAKYFSDFFSKQNTIYKQLKHTHKHTHIKEKDQGEK